jgi:hypothetical protein
VAADTPPGATEALPPRRCPICGRPAQPPPLRPFCSARCRQVDLGRWLAGDYAIPGDAAPDAPDAER